MANVTLTAKPGSVLRQASARMKLHSKKLVVAVDGSNMSVRGLYLAAFIRKDGDTIEVITVAKSTGEDWHKEDLRYDELGCVLTMQCCVGLLLSSRIHADPYLLCRGASVNQTSWSCRWAPASYRLSSFSCLRAMSELLPYHDICTHPSLAVCAQALHKPCTRLHTAPWLCMRWPSALLCCARLVRCGVPVSSTKIELIDPSNGSPAEAIIKHAATLRRGAGVMLMGASGKGMQAKVGCGLSLGSTAEQVLTQIKCPLILLKHKELHDVANSVSKVLRLPMRVMMCANTSHTCKAAFDAAYHFCRPGDELYVVHVDQGTDTSGSSRYWEGEVGKLAAHETTIAISYHGLQVKRTVADTMAGASAFYPGAARVRHGRCLTLPHPA